MYETVLFDFDGTLVPTLDFWLDGFKYAFGKLGISVSEDEIINHCFYRTDVQISETFKLENLDTFWGLSMESVGKSYAAPILFPGVREVLDYCRHNGIRAGIVTSSEKSFINTALSALGLEEHFGVVVTANDVANYKPHPEPVLQALSKLGASSESTLFVGDYVVDVQAGKAAGTQTAVYFTNGHSRFHTYEHIASAEPDFFFDSYHDLLNKLKGGSLCGLSRN